MQSDPASGLMDSSISASSINSLARIRSSFPALAASEARVANWIMQQPQKIIHLSMAQVAKACGVSDTTVLRFCRNTGFQGYTDLKLSIARDVVSPTQIIHDDIAEGDGPAVLLDGKGRETGAERVDVELRHGVLVLAWRPGWCRC